MDTEKLKAKIIHGLNLASRMWPNLSIEVKNSEDDDAPQRNNVNPYFI